MNPGETRLRRFEIPPGFARPGWLCTRCDKPVSGIPDHVDGTQKCPHCKHWAVEWVPPLDPDPEMHQLTSAEARAQRDERREQYVTRERAAELFAQARDAIEDGTAAALEDEGGNIEHSTLNSKPRTGAGDY